MYLAGYKLCKRKRKKENKLVNERAVRTGRSIGTFYTNEQISKIEGILIELNRDNYTTNITRFSNVTASLISIALDVEGVVEKVKMEMRNSIPNKNVVGIVNKVNAMSAEERKMLIKMLNESKSSIFSDDEE